MAVIRLRSRLAELSEKNRPELAKGAVAGAQ
jgi:hypothetical protein